MAVMAAVFLFLWMSFSLHAIVKVPCLRLMVS